MPDDWGIHARWLLGLLNGAEEVKGGADGRGRVFACRNHHAALMGSV